MNATADRLGPAVLAAAFGALLAPLEWSFADLGASLATRPRLDAVVVVLGPGDDPEVAAAAAASSGALVVDRPTSADTITWGSAGEVRRYGDVWLPVPEAGGSLLEIPAGSLGLLSSTTWLAGRTAVLVERDAPRVLRLAGSEEPTSLAHVVALAAGTGRGGGLAVVGTLPGLAGAALLALVARSALEPLSIRSRIGAAASIGVVCLVAAATARSQGFVAPALALAAAPLVGVGWLWMVRTSLAARLLEEMAAGRGGHRALASSRDREVGHVARLAAGQRAVADRERAWSATFDAPSSPIAVFDRSGALRAGGPTLRAGMAGAAHLDAAIGALTEVPPEEIAATLLALGDGSVSRLPMPGQQRELVVTRSGTGTDAELTMLHVQDVASRDAADVVKSGAIIAVTGRLRNGLTALAGVTFSSPAGGGPDRRETAKLIERLASELDNLEAAGELTRGEEPPRALLLHAEIPAVVEGLPESLRGYVRVAMPRVSTAVRGTSEALEALGTLVRALADGGHHVTVRLRPGLETSALVLEDDGGGLPSDSWDRLLREEPLGSAFASLRRQGASIEARNQPGAGLELAISLPHFA